MKSNWLHASLLGGLWIASVGAAGAAVIAEEAWIRAMAPGQTSAAAYLRLRSDVDAKVIEVRTPAAEHGEIHDMKVEGGVMKMRQIAALPLPAGRTVELKPGGHHLMLMRVVNPLKAGDRVPLTLIVETDGKQREEVRVTAEVRSGRQAADTHRHHH